MRKYRQQEQDVGRGRSRLDLLSILAGVGLLAMLGLAGAQPRDTPPSTTQPAVPLPEQVMAELRAANAARAERLKAEQAWALEAEKLRLLKSAVLGEADHFKTVGAKAKADRAALAEQVAGARAERERVEQVEAMVDALAERLEEALAALAAKALPGVVPIDRAAAITDPAARLAAAVERLGQTERQVRKAGVELVAGTLDGKSVTVKLLRAGGVAAWWMSLDGTQAGQAVAAAGLPVLTPARTEADREAIGKAFAVAEGQAAPVWATLPVHHVKLVEKGAKR